MAAAAPRPVGLSRHVGARGQRATNDGVVAALAALGRAEQVELLELARRAVPAETRDPEQVLLASRP